MQGIYTRYRVEKRKKGDKGQTNSQESGFSLVENIGPMEDIMPPSPVQEGDVTSDT